MTTHQTGDPPFVVLGVSAGIAAYKAVEVCRGLVDAGIHVAPVLTERATRLRGQGHLRCPRVGTGTGQPVGRGVGHPPHPAGPVRRSDRGGTGHRRPPGPVRRRLRRRSAHLDPGGDDGPGGRVSGHAHRDVGAPGGPPESERPAFAAGSRWYRPRRAGWPGGTSGPAGWPNRR